MKKSFIWVGSVIGAGAVLALVFGWLERPREVRTVSVSGECLTTAPKDRTAITLRVTTLDTSAAVSMKQATAKATERFSDFAFNTEPTAAMAEPPQIAVPELKR